MDITGYQEGEKKAEVRPQIVSEGAPSNNTSALDLSTAPAEKSDDAPDEEKHVAEEALVEKKLFINITPIENLDQQVTTVKQEGVEDGQGPRESLLQ